MLEELLGRAAGLAGWSRGGGYGGWCGFAGRPCAGDLLGSGWADLNGHGVAPKSAVRAVGVSAGLADAVRVRYMRRHCCIKAMISWPCTKARSQVPPPLSVP